MHYLNAYVSAFSWDSNILAGNIKSDFIPHFIRETFGTHSIYGYIFMSYNVRQMYACGQSPFVILDDNMKAEV